MSPATALAAVPRDLVGDPDAIRRETGRLFDRDPAVWHEAQHRLAWAGPQALAIVDSAFALRPERADRVLAYAGCALLATVQPEELHAYPRLRELVRPGEAEARRLTRTLARDSILIKDPGLIIGDPPPPSTTLVAGSKLFELGGLAVPAAVDLCKDRRPWARARGMDVLNNLGAYAQLGRIRAMQTDLAAFPTDMGCYESNGLVRDDARQVVTDMESRARLPYGFVFILYHDPGLVHYLGDHAPLDAPRTWSAWWKAARPAWVEYWSQPRR
jgi:hypothetical protein